MKALSQALDNNLQIRDLKVLFLVKNVMLEAVVFYYLFKWLNTLIVCSFAHQLSMTMLQME